MKDLTLGQFLDRLASADPTPGGGSASAVAGAMAAALLAMVARLSQRKAADGETFAQSVDQAERVRGTLMALAAQDAAAFQAVLMALRMPRTSEDEKQIRQAEVQRTLRGAAEVPLRAAREILTVLQLAPSLARTGAAQAISDVAAGALLGYAALNGALYNVRINLGAITDEAYVATVRAEVAQLNGASAALRDETMAAVRERMR